MRVVPVEMRVSDKDIAPYRLGFWCRVSGVPIPVSLMHDLMAAGAVFASFDKPNHYCLKDEALEALPKECWEPAPEVQ